MKILPTDLANFIGYESYLRVWGEIGASNYKLGKLLVPDNRVNQIYTYLKPENLRNAVELLN